MWHEGPTMINAVRGRRSVRRSAIGATGVSISLALVLSGCGTSDAGGDQAESLEDAPEITLSWALTTPETGGQAYTKLIDDVAEASDGKLTIEPYWSGSLLGVTDMLSGVSSGAADMGDLYATFTPQLLPIADWEVGLMNGASTTHPLNLLGYSVAGSEIMLNNEDAIAEFTEQNTVALVTSTSSAAYGILCTEPVGSLAEAKGKRVAVGSALFAAEAEAIGMVPVTMPPADQYEGLQRGTIDCTMDSPQSPVIFGYWEVAPYWTLLPVTGYNGTRTVMNLDTWNELPRVYQQIIWDALPAHVEERVQVSLNQHSTFAEVGVAEHELEFIQPDDDLVETLVDAQKKRMADLIANAPAGLSDPQGTADQFSATVAANEENLASSIGFELSGDPEDDFVNGATLDFTDFTAEISRIYGEHRPE